MKVGITLTRKHVTLLLLSLIGVISLFYLHSPLVVEKDNKIVHFYAMQSIVTFCGLTVLQVLVGILSSLM